MASLRMMYSVQKTLVRVRRMEWKCKRILRSHKWCCAATEVHGCAAGEDDRVPAEEPPVPVFIVPSRRGSLRTRTIETSCNHRIRRRSWFAGKDGIHDSEAWSDHSGESAVGE